MEHISKMLDITAPKAVEVSIVKEPSGYKIWINTEDGCRLRISHAKDLQLSGEITFKNE